MSTTAPREVVTARIYSQDIAQLRQLADEQDSTVSRLVARAVAEFAAARRQQPSTDAHNH
jgi:predicted transcriptional regulator